MTSVGLLGLLAIPSENLVESAGAVNTRAFEGGDGSVGDPFQISDVDQLQEMSANLSAHYVLINDIDASATVGWNSGEGFIPIGNMTPLTDWFVGSLDGQGYNITDLFINRISTDNVGLFGITGDAASLSNIGLIDNNVSGDGAVGGLVGESVGTIDNCYTTGVVIGTGNNIGGLVGRGSGSVSNCYATGDVSSIGHAIGGLAGTSYSLSNCYATGDVSGNDEIGGLVGFSDGPVENCYATGSVSGDTMVGGLVGDNWGETSDCYATGSVSGTMVVGGLVGLNGHTVENCFWDTETSGMATSDWGTGKTTAEMKTESTFTSAGWDLSSVWGILNGSSYPFLQSRYHAPWISFSNETVVDLEEDSYFTAAFEYEIFSYPSENSIQSKSLDTNASWLTWDAVNNTIYGTPMNDDIGSYWVNFTVTDTLGSTTKSILLTVVNTNDAPAIFTLDNTSCFEDLLYVNNYTAIDVDPTADTFTWSLNTSAVWLGINSTTGALSGTPTNDDVGTFWVNVTVSDGNDGEDYTNFTLTVVNTNDAPAIVTSDIITATEDALYSVDYNATDMDPIFDTLTWNLSTNAGWLTMDPSLGWLNGTPTNDDVGTFWVQVEVDDGNNGSDVHEFNIVVSNTNDAPAWSLAPGDRNMTEGEVLFLDCLATDVDGDDIIYSITTTPVSDLTINPSTGSIRWGSSVVGTYTVTITATDGTLEAHHSFSILVNALSDDDQTDTDGDGMPDEWEETYGLDPSNATDATLDLDGDGISNLDEFKQGSDPTVDGSSDIDDRGSIATICLLMGLIIFIPLVIIVVIVALVVKSRKGKTVPSEE